MSNDRGKISIIVPIFNASEYIKQTIDNVRKQTWSDWELILVEDQSTDDTREVLIKQVEALHDDRIHVIYKEKNEGAAKARNTGLLKATGRYIAFLDADDIWLPDKLEKEMQFMRQKEAGFVFSAYEFGDEQGKGTGKIVNVPNTLTYRQALSRTVIFTTTVLFDTTIVKKEWIQMPDVPSEDTATWWQILRHDVTAYGLNEVTAIYRRPSKSLSSNKGKAVVRIWNLYRRVEHISLPLSICFFLGWAFRATLRRL